MRHNLKFRILKKIKVIYFFNLIANFNNVECNITVSNSSDLVNAINTLEKPVPFLGDKYLEWFKNL